ncbi:L-lactate dehydrogenase [Longimonas sp.]|uniref:L-lactate dehydrogenase n=1 Tax=Longimonas sp. TaxID=2039626 RepID=UPI00336565E6
MIQRRTIGIVGVGNVGKAAAYALFNQRLASEIILLDVDHKRAEGEAMDLMHGQMLVGNVSARAGRYPDMADAQLIVISAGASQQSPGETRLELLERNVRIFEQVVNELDEHAPNAMLVVATNPVDVLTYVTQELSDRPAERIIGTGTLLDTARFRALLGRHYGVDPRSVHAYILGEHGDSEVPIWSNATIGNQLIKDGPVVGKEFDENTMHKIFEDARDAAYQIIERKGHTDTAIGVVIARIVRAVVEDQRSVLPVSVQTSGAYGIEDVCLSLPAVVGRHGIDGRVTPKLTAKEHDGLHASADVLKKSREGLSL